MGHTQRYKLDISTRKDTKKKRRTRRKKICGGGRDKPIPKKCQTKTKSIVSGLNTKRINERTKHIARRPTSDSEILQNIISHSDEITFLSNDSLYSTIYKMKITTGFIIVGGYPLTEFIMKLCIISTEQVEFETTWFQTKKLSYNKEKINNEFDFLSENSVLDICPEPIYISIFDCFRYKKIFEEMTLKIPDREPLIYIKEVWKNLQKLKKSCPSNTDYGLGILLMEFIPGETARVEIDKPKVDYNINYVILIKILYKLILLYLNGFIHLDCHLKNIIMRPLTETDPPECVLDYSEPQDSNKQDIAIALSQYKKTAILIDFGDVARVEEVFPREPQITIVDKESMMLILHKIMGLHGIEAYHGWFSHFDFPTLDSLIRDIPEIFHVLYDYYIQNTPFDK